RTRPRARGSAQGGAPFATPAGATPAHVHARAARGGAVLNDAPLNNGAEVARGYIREAGGLACTTARTHAGRILCSVRCLPSRPIFAPCSGLYPHCRSRRDRTLRPMVGDGLRSTPA